MQRRTALFVLAVALVTVTAVAMPGAASLDEGGASPASQPDGMLENTAIAGEHINECAADPPEDFADPEDGNEVIGWVDGFWYNEPLNLEIDDDGLSEDELEDLSARTAARFEAMRCITADEGVPPVEIQSREEFQDEQAGFYENVGEEETLSDNAKFEAMLMIDSERNSIDVREENRGDTVGGFYSFEENRVVIVSDDPDSLLIDEEILAHELGHAIQDQQFDLSRFDRPTTDIDNGKLALIEGDVHLVEGWYLEACEEGLWDEPCVTEGVDDEAGGGDLASWGLYFKSWQPYNDGPAFIEYLREEAHDGGWEEIDALYDDPPETALHTVYPEKFNEVELADVDVPDQSSGDWERITLEDSIDYDTLGVAGISAMFKAPTYETNGMQNVYDPQFILNTGADGEIDDFQPVNYAHPETEGWRDDKLYTYRNGDDAGAVWTLEWASAEDMEPFLSSYEELVDIRNGEAVEGYEHTYTFEDASDYDMALTIVPDGSTVTIVTAPTVDDLTEIHDVELVEADDTDDPTPTPTPADGDDATPTPDDADDTEPAGAGDDSQSDDTADADDDGAGFGIVAGALAVVLATLAIRHRQ